jgi:hypothetical protein
MKKTIRIMISFLMILSIISTSIVFSFADSSKLQEYEREKEYQPISLDEVSPYIIRANDIKYIEINNNEIKYHIGDNYIVVEEEEAFYLVTFNKNDMSDVRVNGKLINSFVTETIYKNESNITDNLMIEGDVQPLSSSWNYWSTTNRHYDVGSLPISVGVALLIGLPNPVTAALIGSLTQMFISGNLPISYFLTHKTITHWRVHDIFIGTTEWWHQHSIYGGQITDLYKSYLYGWETISIQ